jgi:hypothetical protein
MNTQTLLNFESSKSQDNSIGAQSATPTHNGKGHSPRPPIIHLRRFAHFSWCGKDLDFYANAIAIRKKARAYDREHTAPPSVVVIKQRSGLVSVETALQLAAERTASHGR